MSDTQMTQAQFDQIMMKFEGIDMKFAHIEKHMVTKSDVNAAVFQGLAFAAAAIVGTVVVLNALGAFDAAKAAVGG